jgi:hypothetical protein
MQRKLKYFSKVIVTAFLFGMVSSGAYADTYVWPGSAPCNTTLQNCIDNVGSGDTVEIATDTVDESITFDKSLTLRPATGYSPRFINTQSIVASSIGSTDNSITIQGIAMETGVIIVTHTSSGTFTLNLFDNTIERSFSYGQAIRFWPISGGKTFFNISSNNITVPSGDQMHGIQLHTQSDIEGNISNNVIVMEGATQGTAIEVVNMGGSAIVDIIGNTVSGTNMNKGIEVYQYTAGCNTDTRIANNLITGQVGNVGGPGAITFYINDGHVNLEVVNNTVADNEEGIMLYCDPGTASGKIANNIIVNNTSQGLYIDSDVTAAVSNNHNLIYNNYSNSFTPGAGTLYGDPLFVGGEDYRLQPLSAAVNKGDNASVPSGITTDLDGNPRIFGPVVDMGAYELQELPPAIAVPTDCQSFTYSSVTSPVLSADPSQAKPMGLGTVAEGGGILSITVKTYQFSDPVDIYFGLYSSEIDPNNYYLLTSGGTFQKLSEGLAPWKANITGPINESLLGNIQTSSLPEGTYYLYLLVTPTGNLSNYYLWITNFSVEQLS